MGVQVGGPRKSRGQQVTGKTSDYDSDGAESLQRDIMGQARLMSVVDDSLQVPDASAG